MSKKLVSNANMMELFKTISAIQVDDTLTENERARKTKQIQDDIIKQLSFLVYGQTRQYRSFPNYEDLVQEGFIGLMTAVYKFDHTINTNFFAYAEAWIRHSVKRAASRFDIVYNPNKVRVVYSEPSEDEVDASDGPEEILFTKERKDVIDKVLGEFSDREREIVYCIFGLSGRKQQTLREIGPQFDLTHERVRQIKNSVIDKLKKHQDMIEMSRV